MNYETQFASDVNMEPMGIDEDRARKRRRIIIAIVIAAVVLIAAALAFGKKSDGAADSAGGAAVSAPVVTVLSPGQSSVQRTVTATGSLNARIDMPVGVVGEGGQVVRVLVQPGDWVRAGQTLAVIERSVQSEQAKSLAAQIAVAQADAKLAKAQLDRARQLVGRGFISQADIDQREATLAASNARVGVAQAQLAEQRARNGRLDIRAPASGLVLTRAVEPGQVVGTGSGVLFRVAKNGEMELRAMLSEGDLAVSIVTSTGDAPLLPESAVQSDPAGNYVYIVNAKNQVERRAVTVGQVSSAGVAVTSGLNGKERIVASAGAFLNPGQKVKPELQKTDSQNTAG